MLNFKGSIMTASIFVMILYGYLAIGFVFALWFVTRGVNKIDSGMHGVHWGVRALLIPGSTALWPVLLRKYLKI